MAKKKKRDTLSLTARELEVLRWVQQGKTNEEVATILGRTKWTVKFHLSSVMKKFDVTTRTQAVSQAMSMGLLAPTEFLTEEAELPRFKVGIVGCGKGGEAVLKLFKDNPSVTVVWAADKDPQAPGVRLVNELSIPTSTCYTDFLDMDVDVVINLTDSKGVAEDLRARLSADIELMSGLSARIMWQLFEERRRRVEERDRILREHETLYHLGLVIESIDSLKDAALAILDYATRLTGTPAGSLAIFDDKREDMFMAASKGFSREFASLERWEIRKGGLTGKVLNQDGPLIINDIREDENPNPALIKEGVRALLGAPLTVEGRVVGILYVNDFKKRSFRAEDVSLFSLLTVYAGLTIERVRSLEEMRMLSITDGLTSLYNQRYLMEQLQSEVKRASRHKQEVSVMMLDIDLFKDYNDTFGHLDGNKVLKAIGRLLQKSSRANDTVSRFGGEEFCIVMSQVGKKGARVYGKRLLKLIRDYDMPNRKITVSAGIATYPEDAKSYQSLLKKADKRLYEAKEKGRDRVCC